MEKHILLKGVDLQLKVCCGYNSLCGSRYIQFYVFFLLLAVKESPTQPYTFPSILYMVLVVPHQAELHWHPQSKKIWHHCHCPVDGKSDTTNALLRHPYFGLIKHGCLLMQYCTKCAATISLKKFVSHTIFSLSMDVLCLARTS